MQNKFQLCLILSVISFAGCKTTRSVNVTKALDSTGYSCGECTDTASESETNQWRYKLLFEGEFVEWVPAFSNDFWQTKGKCLQVRSGDTRCTSTVPTPSPTPSPSAASDDCDQFVSLDACFATPTYARGCRWSPLSRKCYNGRAHPCSFYSVHGLDACFGEDNGKGPYDRGCRWESSNKTCYLQQ